MTTKVTTQPLEGAQVEYIRVWFDGDTAVSQGMGACYEVDSLAKETPATELGNSRAQIVKLPDVGNNDHFAGVITRDYTAVTGGQFIELAIPGSVIQIKTVAAVTIGDYLTCDLGLGDETSSANGTTQGDWQSAGYRGKGTARVIQTVAAAGLANAILDGGLESGLMQTLVTTATATVAVTISGSGVTRIDGVSVTTSGNDVTATLADHTVGGTKKGIIATAVPAVGATSDIIITVTSGLQQGATTALATITFTADGQIYGLEWFETEWQGIVNSGATEA